MSEAVLASNPRDERPLFDLFWVDWQYTRATVLNIFTGSNVLHIMRPMGPGSIRQLPPSYYLEFNTPDGPVAVEVSKRHASLTQVGDAVPLKYRKGRRSGRLQAEIMR